MAPANYAVPDDALTIIDNVVWADPDVAPIPPSWILCNPGPGVGWTSSDGGQTWQPPDESTPDAGSQPVTLADLAALLGTDTATLQSNIATDTPVVAITANPVSPAQPDPAI
jgi:hypothetical protein